MSLLTRQQLQQLQRMQPQEPREPKLKVNGKLVQLGEEVTLSNGAKAEVVRAPARWKGGPLKLRIVKGPQRGITRGPNRRPSGRTPSAEYLIRKLKEDHKFNKRSMMMDIKRVNKKVLDPNNPRHARIIRKAGSLKKYDVLGVDHGGNGTRFMLPAPRDPMSTMVHEKKLRMRAANKSTIKTYPYAPSTAKQRAAAAHARAVKAGRATTTNKAVVDGFNRCLADLKAAGDMLDHNLVKQVRDAYKRGDGVQANGLFRDLDTDVKDDLYMCLVGTSAVPVDDGTVDFTRRGQVGGGGSKNVVAGFNRCLADLKAAGDMLDHNLVKQVHDAYKRGDHVAATRLFRDLDTDVKDDLYMCLVGTSAVPVDDGTIDFTA